jgi:hypothetical protein
MATTSKVTSLAPEIGGSALSEQEVFAQHGLSIGRGAASTTCIDGPEVDRIHARILRRSEETMMPECEDDRASILLADEKRAPSIALVRGTEFRVGSAIVHCQKRESRRTALVSGKLAAFRCPECQGVIRFLVARRSGFGEREDLLRI